MDYSYSKDCIDDIFKHVKYNRLIADYYNRLFEDEKEDKFKKKSDNVLNCQKFWRIRHYQKIRCKEVEKVTLCHDKFCNNCKKVIQSARSMKFLPLLKEHDENLYHLTLTVPSCIGAELKDVIKHMFKCFKKLCDYLSGKIKLDLNKEGAFSRNFNFFRYGYLGALRSLEVTWFKNSDGDIMFHPHLHCAMVFDDFVIDSKNQEVSPYSYKRNDPNIYPFSQDDIFFQRIWYLIWNDVSINKKNVEELWRVRKKLNDGILGGFKNVGYSCNLMKFDKGEYAELFKYMVKECDYDKNVLSYDTFKTLYFSLKGVRQLQGYGCLYNVKDCDYEEEFLSIEEGLQEYLSNFSFKTMYEKINVVRGNIYNGQLYISKKKIFSYLLKLHASELPQISGKEKYKNTVIEFTNTFKAMKNDIKKSNSLGKRATSKK